MTTLYFEQMMMQKSLMYMGVLMAASSFGSTNVLAAETLPSTDNQMRTCLEQSVLTADKSMTVRQLEEACTILLTQSELNPSENNPALQPNNSQANPASTVQKSSEANPGSNKPAVIETSNSSAKKADSSAAANDDTGMLSDRIAVEALNRSNRFVLTPYRRNYILPITYTDSPNTAPYKQSLANNESDKDLAFSDLRHAEFEFQLSLKLLLLENIFDDNGNFYLGYTNHSLWQLYNRETSAPFRETNHQPEFILSFNNDFEIFGFRNVLNEFSLNHQSNGQSGVLSRSWNRVMFNSVFEGKNVTFAINPWYRLPESDSSYPGDPSGDDNPDITHYMGHFQFTGAYKYKSNIFSVELRNNLESENRGAVELGWTFPLTPTMRGYFNYFDGYGHTLIDYNVKQQVVGMGITFTDLF